MSKLAFFPPAVLRRVPARTASSPLAIAREAGPRLGQARGRNLDQPPPPRVGAGTAGGPCGIRRALFGVLVLAVSGCSTPPSQEPPAGPANPPPPVAIRPPSAPVSTAGSRAPAEPDGAWRLLFDGKTLQGWGVSDFAGSGGVKVGDGKIVLENGVMTGVNWTNTADLPRVDYEIALDAMRVEGSDFFCALTFPVKEDPCSFIVGGWGGGVVGLSSLDGQDAANNDTTKYMNFDNGRWFAIRVRVTGGRIQCWIDNESIVNVETKDRRISIRPEVEASRPLGIAAWSTTAALKNIRLRRL